jgi:hypothetical protein
MSRAVICLAEKYLGRVGGFARRDCPGVSTGIARQPLELPPVTRVAEHHIVSGTREDRAELSAYQPRTQNTDPHALSDG